MQTKQKAKLAEKDLFVTANELFEYLAKIYNGEDVDIATFSMYLGIAKGRDWSKLFPQASRKFVDKVRKRNLRLLLGLPRLSECTPGCPACAEKYAETLYRHQVTAKRLRLNVRVHPSSHMKYYRVGDLVIVGGINLSTAKDMDAAVVVKDPDQQRKLRMLFEELWMFGTEITQIKLPNGLQKFLDEIRLVHEGV